MCTVDIKPVNDRAPLMHPHHMCPFYSGNSPTFHIAVLLELAVKSKQAAHLMQYVHIPSPPSLHFLLQITHQILISPTLHGCTFCLCSSNS